MVLQTVPYVSEVSPDGRHALALNKEAIVIDVERRHVRWRFAVQDLLADATFTADGSELVLLDDRDVVRVSLESGTELERVRLHRAFTNVKRLTDGSFLVNNQECVETVNWRPGAEPVVIPLDGHDLCQGPDRGVLASGLLYRSNGALTDARSGMLVHDFSDVRAARGSPDGRFFAAITDRPYQDTLYPSSQDDRELTVWRVPEMEVVATLSTTGRWIERFELGPNHLAVVSRRPFEEVMPDDGRLEVYALDTGERISRIDLAGEVLDIAMGPEPDDLAVLGRPAWDSPTGELTRYRGDGTPSFQQELPLAWPHINKGGSLDWIAGTLWVSDPPNRLRVFDPGAGIRLASALQPSARRPVSSSLGVRWSDDARTLTVLRRPCRRLEWDLEAMTLRVEEGCEDWASRAATGRWRTHGLAVRRPPTDPPSPGDTPVWVERRHSELAVKEGDQELWTAPSRVEHGGRPHSFESATISPDSLVVGLTYLRRDYEESPATDRSPYVDHAVTRIHEVASGAVLGVFEGSAVGLSTSPARISTLTEGRLRVWQVSDTRLLLDVQLGHDVVGAPLLSPDGRRVMAGTRSGTVVVLHVATGARVTLVEEQGEWLILGEGGVFAGSRSAATVARVGVGDGEIVALSQYALRANRPDLLMQRFESSESARMGYYEQLVQRRLDRFVATLTAAGLEPGDGRGNAPVATVVDVQQAGRTATITTRLKQGDAPLALVQAFVNDVPLHAGFGVPVPDPEQATMTFEVPLLAGRNEVEVSALDASGVESLRQPVVLDLPDGGQGGTVVLLTLAVSDYEDDALDLGYAHADALDLARLVSTMESAGQQVRTHVLIDKGVTPEAIVAAKGLLEQTRPEDTVVLHIAGHGRHDQQGYVFLTHEASSTDPRRGAVDFDLLEDLLSGIPARKKLFLMDTCESGELEPAATEGALALIEEAGVSRGVRARGLMVVPKDEPPPGPQRPWLHERDRFVHNDLVRRTGAIVLSSSRGGQASFESDALQNGFFTHAVLEALASSSEADTDSSGTVDDDELRHYVRDRVSEMTGGAQQPVVDRDNLVQQVGLSRGSARIEDLERVDVPPNGELPPRTTPLPPGAELP